VLNASAISIFSQMWFTPANICVKFWQTLFIYLFFQQNKIIKKKKNTR